MAVYWALIDLQDIETGSAILSYQAAPIVHRMVGGIAAPFFDAATGNKADYGRLMIAETLRPFVAGLMHRNNDCRGAPIFFSKVDACSGIAAMTWIDYWPIAHWSGEVSSCAILRSTARKAEPGLSYFSNLQGLIVV
jgi:hypothetical protein